MYIRLGTRSSIDRKKMNVYSTYLLKLQNLNRRLSDLLTIYKNIIDYNRVKKYNRIEATEGENTQIKDVKIIL